MARTGKIFLAKNIKLDKNYKSVLNYNEDQMISLMSETSNLVYFANNYTFIRERGSIQVNAPYSQCVQANYLAFQNPDYSGKYFFAFIDEIKYLSQNASEIIYTIDVWTTWFSYWTAKACFVVREHVIDDSIGANTVPESVELGEYISVQNPTKILSDPTEDFYVCMAVTETPGGTIPVNDNKLYNGIYSGLMYFICQTPADCTTALKQYAKAGKIESVYAIFMVPKDLTSILDGQWSQWTMNYLECTVCYLANSTTADNITNLNGTFPTHLGVSYTPVNKKLYTFPYSYMILDNNSGISQPFYYEDFEDSILHPGTKVIGFWIDACLSIGMNMKAIPVGYKNINLNYAYGVQLGKLPVCSWVSDAYINWLTQESLNMPLQLAGNFMQTLTNPQAGIMGIGNSIAQIYNRSFTPYQSEGNLGAGDVNFADPSDGGLTLYYMSIRDEFAERIDQYFTRMGYKINKVKIPNMSNRQNYNYVQVAQEENVAYPNNYNNICLPAKALDQINSLFRSGVTIWNNHGNFGDYSVTNTNTYTPPTP